MWILSQLKKKLKQVSTSIFNLKSKVNSAGLFLPAAPTQGVLSLWGTQHSTLAKGGWSSLPGSLSEQSPGVRSNQKQTGSPEVEANLSPDIYHFLYNKFRDFYLQVFLYKNSINASIFYLLGCLQSLMQKRGGDGILGRCDEGGAALARSLGIVCPSLLPSRV